MISSSVFYFDTCKVGLDSSEQFQKAYHCASEIYESKNLHVIFEENFRLFCLKESIDETLFETSNEIVFFFGSIKNLDKINSIVSSHADSNIAGAPSNISEAIYRLFQIHGKDAFNYINGLFTYISHNKSTGKSEIYIDRFGTNFCYYFSDDSGILCSSSMDLLFSTGIKREFSLDGIDDYLSYRITQPPLTIVKDIYKVPQGHYLEYKNEPILASYIKFDDKIEGENDDQFYINRFADDFTNAVNHSFDMPNSCFTLSGGVDSSIIAKLASEHAKTPIDTFNLSVGKKNYQDEFFSNKIAKELNTNHKTIKLSHEDIANKEFFNFCMGLIDEPTVNSYPNEIKLNLEASSLFDTTVYGSMAAQAYFEGYYWKDALEEKHYLFSKIYKYVSVKIQKINLFNGKMSLLKKILLRLIASLKLRSLTKSEKIEEANRLFTDYFKKELYSEHFYDEVSKKPKRKAIDLFNNLKLSNDVNKAMYTEYYCMSLARNSLFNSMHQKFLHFFYYPYLDTKFADHNLQNPAHLKLEKIIAKKAFASKGLDSSFSRQRQGMSISYEWLGDELKYWTEEILINTNHSVDILFNKKSIKFMIKAHSEKKYDFGAYLWALITLKCWAINKKVTLPK
jgi:asparagine synthase (glutamine-hydrolysing)